MLSHETSLVDIIVQRLKSGQLHLPVFPPLAIEIRDMLAMEACDIQTIASKISQDQVLASEILRVANSTFFTGLTKVATIADAILRLGAKQITSIVYLVTQRQLYSSCCHITDNVIQKLWMHSISCALGSKWLAHQIGQGARSEEAFLAGLLHDIGKLFLLKVIETIHLSEDYDFKLTQTVILDVLRSLHAEKGGDLLEQWNLPEQYCIVAREHHRSTFDHNDVILTIVRLVNLTCAKLGLALWEDCHIVLPATPEAQILSCSELLLAELEIVIEDAKSLAQH